MQVTKQALVAGVAAALTFIAGAQQPPDLGIKPVMLHAEPYTFDTAEQHGIKVSVVVHGLAHPFSLAFLPNGDALVTERGTKLRLVHGAASGKGAATLDPQPIAGAPEPGAFRGAGIAEVALHPKFAENHWVYFTYNKPGAEIPNSNPPGRRQAAVALGARQARGLEAHRRARALRRRMGERQQRLTARIRQRRPALHDDGRAVRRLGPEPWERLWQSLAVARRRQAGARQPVRRQDRRAARDLHVRPS